MIRTLSYSEVSMALDCQAKHAFAYTGHLTGGDALKPKAVAPVLVAGRAWGRAVAALHTGMEAADEALRASLDQDADRQREWGVYDPAEHVAMVERLTAILEHHYESAEITPMDAVTERELLVGIPSRTGSRRSSRYRLVSFLDATRTTDEGVWLVEFKLRGRLSRVEQIAMARQVRWYAWAYWQATGIAPVGVEVHERLHEAPKAPRLVKGRTKGGDTLVPSHAKDQMCTADAYERICREFDVSPRAETVEALTARKWHQVVPVMLRPGELEEVGHELVSAAKLIASLDSGDWMPLRNTKQTNCGYCQFREICPNPDPDLVDALFERKSPKRERQERHDDSSQAQSGSEAASGQPIPF